MDGVSNPRPPSCLGTSAEIGGGSGDSVYASVADTVMGA